MAETNLVQLKNTLAAPNVKAKFEDMLGKRAPQFITSISSVVSQSALLQKADVNSIVMGAAVAASMDLPLSPSLGYAALVPYNDTKKGICYAQFQVMRNGWVELLIRTGQCVSVINEVVREGELVEYNRFTGEAKFQDLRNPELPMIGVMAYFKLTNGFEKTLYMSKEEIMAHAKKYSQSFRKGYGNWKDDFEGMALKGLSVDTLIKTYNKGWTTMGDIEKGDVVFDGEGRLTRVIAVSERKNIPCYKITFGNGQEVICDEEHDWVVRHKSYNTTRQINIKELYDIKQKGDSISILTTQQGGFDIELPIDPYCLGYWLGNGNQYHPVVTCNSQDTEYVAQRFRNAGYATNISKNSENSDNIRISRPDKSVRTGGFGQALKSCGLLMNKHVPDIYEFASYDQRLELIRGLLDSDGSCCIRKQGSVRVSFSQEASKKHIVDALYRLLCSIGEQPSRVRKIRGHGFGKYIDSYSIQFTPREDVFGVPRKKDMERNRYLCPSWSIKSIEKIDSVETVCIAVDSPSKTYLCTESQIKTHNTVLKRLITKFAPKSLERIAEAIEYDQSIVVGNAMNPDVSNATPTYVDNPSNEQEIVDVEEVKDVEDENESRESKEKGSDNTKVKAQDNFFGNEYND